MELSAVIEKRQSARKFKPSDVPDKDLARIIQSAGRAPSGKNSQNWHFVAIKNRQLIEKIGFKIQTRNEAISTQLDQIDPSMGQKFRKFVQGYTLSLLDAPVVVVVYSTTYCPSGYNELVEIHAPQTVLDDLLYVRNPGMQNVGAALENFSLAAVDLGYGSCWLTSANYAAVDIEALLKEEIGFQKEGYFMCAVMVLGTPEGDLKSPPKKALEDIYTLVK